MNEKVSPKAASESAAGGTRIQSVARAGKLLLWIAGQPHGATAKEIAKAQGLALPTTYHLLNTLVDEGLLTKDVHRRYVLGRSMAILAQAYIRGKSVPEALLGALRDLARRTEETAYLADWGADEIRVLASVEGSHMVRVAEVSSGPYEYGHARANGKVLLAYAEPAVREAYLRNHPLVPVTPNTIVDPKQFERELATIRERGYAYDEEEYSGGVCCVAAPLLQNDHIIGALGLAVPTDRFKQDRAELTATLLEVVSSLQAAGASQATVPS
jgi:IclR family acetate operon transcriptional repressor